MGVADSKISSTKVLTLMKIAPALVSEAITAAASGTMDKDVFDNGVAYFLGPLLNWTLTGVVRNLLNEWRQSGRVPPSNAASPC
jgi:mediator of RNA polymerase II transcription subunit 5